MLRAPGPIPPLDTSGYPTTYDTPDFTDMVNAALANADPILGSMDAIFDPAAVFDAVPTGDTIMADLDTVDQINGDNAHLANLSGIPNIDAFKANGDTALIAAVQVIPGEAFTPVPAATQWGTQAPAAVTARIASVTIAGLGGSAKSAFAVGDTFEIIVQMDTTTGNANDYFQVAVTVTMVKDGFTQPDLNLGETDHTGAVNYTGTWQATDTGNWFLLAHATPSTGGQIDSSEVQWSVAAQPTGGTGPTQTAVKATLINWTSGNLANNHSGDKWQLFVSGPANSPVYLWPTHNGVALTEVTLGTTDSFGNFNLADLWSDADIGDWVEHYGVGHFQMVGNLTFTILPAS